MLSRSERIRRYVEITVTLANREFVGRYRGNLTGILSAVAIPVLFLLTYSFVFSTLIPIRLKGADSVSDYAIFLFSGLIVWNLFSEPLSRSARLFSSSASLVKTSNFPVSSLVSAACLSSFYQSLLWLLVYCIARGVSQEGLHPTLLLIPLVLANFLFFCFGICLLVGSMGVFLREIGDFVAPVVTFWMFISPVLYPSDRIAAVASWLVEWNPLAPPLEMARKLSDGAFPSLELVLSSVLWSICFVLLGVLFYRRVRPILSDVV